MEQEDGRKLSKAALEERRKIIIRMKQQGKSMQDVQDAVGMSHTAVSKTWSIFLAQGQVAAIKGKPRGRQFGEDRHLSSAQEKEIQKKIIDRRPEQLKLDFALWTREAVRMLIQQEYHFTMPIRTVGEYLKRWGFTPQKPVKFAYERKPEKVKAWLEEEFPAIKDRAKQEHAEIYWGDETGLRAGDVRCRGYAPKGKTPVVQATAKYENLSMVSAITNKGHVHWMIVEGGMNIERFIEFLDALVRDAPRKVFLVLDNLKVHHATIVTDWVAAHKEKIELFFLPAYSPDLNPDEHLNADLKQGVGSRTPVRTKANLKASATNHMAMLRQSPERILSYFRDPAIHYASVSF